MVDEDDGATEIPEWVVTFGDMMSLLLTFFIMLVSLSEIKEEEKYQALVESVRQKFGHTMSKASIVPGPAKPRSSAISNSATMGRARKLDIHQGGGPTQAPIGEFVLVHEIRPNKDRSIDAMIVFDEFAYELTDKHKESLQTLALQIGGKPQKLDIRGHTSYKPVPPAGARDHDDLATKRAMAAKRFLVDELHIDSKRIRVSVAGPNEPLYSGHDPQLLARNPRVEVHVLAEFVNQFRGSNENREHETTTEGPLP